jgi:hypothetical protein
MMEKNLQAEGCSTMDLQPEPMNAGDERVIWNFGTLTATGYFEARDIKVTITSEGLVTIAFQFVSLNKRSVTKHPGFKVTLKDRQGNVLVDWLSGTQPFTCNTNIAYSKSASFPGIYTSIFYGSILATQFDYRPC